MRHVRESLRFLTTFLRNPTSVGAVLPSSRHLAEAIAGGLDLQGGDLVLEYGPGTGPMTAVLDQQVGNGVRYLGIERNKAFHDLLLRRFPRLQFHLGSVEDVSEILAQRGLGKSTVIVSGLPFASFPAELQDAVIDATCAVLAEGGQFRTFQYVHAYRLAAARRFRHAMARRFKHFERSKAVLRNVPPAYVLTYMFDAAASAPGSRAARSS